MSRWTRGGPTIRAARDMKVTRMMMQSDVIGAQLAAMSGVYVDRYSGRFLAVMDASRRSYAWIYYALHTLQFPGLIAHPEVRTVVVLTLLALGFVFSVTRVILSVVRLRREFS